ncbi:hypothetical protein SNEBB_005748 [Seison nebaliae]|nr:hypothetical protein SNEBB_005748 [Seison nebaliae]
MDLGKKTILIDARHHLLGRLASIVAKALLLGKNVIIVRAELMTISGSLYRNKLKYLEFLRKRCNVNPRRGQFHYRAPSQIFRRVVRGMLPHKTPRGNKALLRLKAFEGIPPRYSCKKRLCVPAALKCLKLKPNRKFCVLGRLSSEVGWKYADVIDKLETKRKVNSNVYYEKKMKKEDVKKKVLKRLNTNKSFTDIDNKINQLVHGQ